jgi:uncharacterized repeat protein (TIGR01451 family)
MKKKLLLFVFLLTAQIGFSQVYQQGDIFVNTNFFGAHDSTLCGTNGNIMYNITISNSFIGDTLLVKDPGSNSLIMMEVNNTGMNPWNLNIPGFGSAPFVPDYQANNGSVDFFAIPMKFKNGTDSIDNIFSFFQVPVTNPCSYGGLTGRVYVDNNSDCIYNSGDGNLQSFYDLLVSANYNGNFFDNHSYTVLGSGNYDIQVQTSYLNSGQLTYANPMLPFAYPNSCTPGIYNFDVNSAFPLSNLDFALQCTSNIDVAAYAGAAGPVRPGIPFMLYPHVSNLGCDTVSGSLQLILDNRVTYNASLSTLPPTSINGDTLTWNYGPISNLSNNGFWNSLTAGLHLTPDTTVNIGDTLCFSVSTNVPGADINASNNQYAVCYPVVNSYDPNIKEVMPKGVGATGVIPPSTGELTYTVHFQNTGNASAINVYIIDTLDVNVIPESIEILGRSHTMTPQWLAPGVLKFNFNNINLADSFSNEPASHGFVTFKAKLESNLNLGTVIENTAYIYFDFNAPIITNTAINTIDLLTTISVQTVNANLSVYPNPAKEELFISINNLNSSTTSYLEIYNIAGQKMMDQSITQQATKVDLSSLSKGLYLLKTNVEGAVSTVKIVKE